MERLDGTGLKAAPDEGLAWAQGYLSHITRTEAIVALDILPEGICFECGRERSARFKVGRFELCRWCALRRLNVANDLVSGRHDTESSAGGSGELNSHYAAMVLHWAQTNANDMSRTEMSKRLDKLPLRKTERRWILKQVRRAEAA